MEERRMGDKGVLLGRSWRETERQETERQTERKSVPNMNRTSILRPAPRTNKASRPNRWCPHTVQRELGQAAVVRT